MKICGHILEMAEVQLEGLEPKELQSRKMIVDKFDLQIPVSGIGTASGHCKVSDITERVWAEVQKECMCSP